MTLRVLFLCSRNRWRSPTAEAIFANRPGLEVDSAGLSPDAEVCLSTEQLEWADLILVMEPSHRKKLMQKFRANLRDQRVGVLHIPDVYEYMDPKLIELLEERCAAYWPGGES